MAGKRQPARDVETTMGKPLGDRISLAGEKSSFEKNRLFVHAPEEGSGSHSISTETLHHLSCIKRHLILQDYSVDPVNIFRILGRREGQFKQIQIRESAVIEFSH